MRQVWGVLLGAVLPLWRDPALLASHGDKIVQVCNAGWLPALRHPCSGVAATRRPWRPFLPRCF
jgi:hypothetical protein